MEQHCTGKILLQCCPRDSRWHCTGKNPVQYHLSITFYLRPVNFSIIIGCCNCRCNIAQEKFLANIEQKDKIVRNSVFVKSWPHIFFAQCRRNLYNVGAAFAATSYYQKINRSWTGASTNWNRLTKKIISLISSEDHCQRSA